MKTKAQTAAIVAAFKEAYADADCSLTYTQPWQLMVSVRLSAQCTDVRVNTVTKELFARYETLESLAGATAAEIEAIVKPCGLGASKARDISGATTMLLTRFDGVLPRTIEELLSIPGVGRKSANLILGDVYGLPAIVADTHCIRISNRIGFVKSTDPVKVENALRKVVAPVDGSDLCHRFVLHGRAICTARTAHCDVCPITALCDTGKKQVLTLTI